ncbi:hypothetical protein [Elioraea thermophila]|uniref:hypothetical protein n=1 Tax=Elioraea thermophila TaxID=2185104 RepID=UPI000DF15866|nr:hypothetical protein [Elioraea thermophila]
MTALPPSPPPVASVPLLSGPVLGRLGPFEVGHDGALSPSGANGPVRFAFLWRERRVQAELAAERRLRLSIPAARVPYTAEQAARRSSVLTAVLALRAGREAELSAVLSPSHEVRLEWRVTLEATTASRLVAAATRFVLAVEPYLQLLEEEGAIPPA